MRISGIYEMSNAPATEDERAFVLLDFRGDDLDPAPLISLIPLTPVRLKKKGDPLSGGKKEKVPIAKVGYCGFTTAGKVPSRDTNEHVRALLDAISGHIDEVRKVMSLQSLIWEALLFEGRMKGQLYSDLDTRLIGHAEELGLPLLPNRDEAMTIVFEGGEEGP
jgi:hypothetical protein